MKVFLFLYPFREFFVHSNGYPDDPELADKVVEYFGQAIDARYRQRGYQVCWLLFRSEGEGLDLVNLDRRVSIQPSDLLVDAGMTFSEHCPCRLRGVLPEDQWPKPIYADLPFVSSQLPGPIEELWVGGFQISDCVEKLARFAYFRLGLKGSVHVDEDLTGMGVWPAKLHLCPRLIKRLKMTRDPFPLVRESWTYESTGWKDDPRWETDRLYVRLRRIRNLRPWLIHN
ncbi:MAG: hypothetical protein AAB669_00640 [Patescibacteria group bacterium]